MTRTPSHTFPAASIAATIGSIILGLLLKRQHQTKIRDTTDDIVRFKLLRTGHSLISAFQNSKRFLASGITIPLV
jgi:hypothetical protein